MKQTMKLSQLRQIIREEVQKLIQPKIPIRLKELINKGWILSEDNQTITNPKTGRVIKVSSALSYSHDHPAYQAAIKSQGADTKSSSQPKSQGANTKSSQSLPSVDVNPQAWKPEVSKDRYGNEVRKFPQSAANDMKRILDKVTGGDSVADINSDTGGIIYNLPNNEYRTITMGIDEKGEFSVQAEDIDDYSIFDKTSKTFKTPQEAMAYAAKLTKDYNN